jgi:hypothetical protein
MQFADRNFRLACIDAIHCAGHLPNVFDQTDSQGLPDRIASLGGVALTDELLGVITDLAPDGGDDVYLFTDPEWGAENADLYISRFDDILLLPNLKSLWVHAVTNEDALDLSLLLRCAALTKVSADSFYVKPSDHNAEIVAELEARGVAMHID